jgi:hypothetical protein
MSWIRNQEPHDLFISHASELKIARMLSKVYSGSSFGRLQMEIHMRTAIILAAGLILSATGAWSQESSRDRDDFDRGSWRDNRDGWDRDRDRRRGHMMRHDDDDGDGDRGDHFERGARFFLRSGDTQLRVVCGNRESTQACVDAALRMFDRVQSQQGTSARPPASSAPAQPPQ